MPHAEAGGNGDALPAPSAEGKRKRFRLEEFNAQIAKERALTFADIAAAPPVETQPLIGDWLYPGAWLFVGRPKVGKGYFLLQMMDAIASGREFLGWHCRLGEVLGILAEDNDTRLQRRLALLDIAHPPLLLPPDGCYVFTREMLKKLARKYNKQEDEDRPHYTFDAWLGLWLDEHPKVRLVVIDTETVVRLIWTGQVQSSLAKITDSDYWSSEQWDDFALKRGLAVVLVNHPSKERGRKARNPHEMINAANTKVGGATGSIVLHDPEGADLLDPRQKQRILSIEGRDMSEDISIGVHQDQQARFVNDGVWYEVRQTQAENLLLEALKVQHEALGFDLVTWITAKQLAEYTGRSVASVKRTLSRTKGNRVWKEFRLLSKLGREGGYRLERIETRVTTKTTGDKGDKRDMEVIDW